MVSPIGNSPSLPAFNLNVSGPPQPSAAVGIVWATASGPVVTSLVNPLPVQGVAATGPLSDAFGRQRVSSPFAVFDSKQVFNNAPLFFENAVTGTGTATYLPNESSTRMRVTTLAGDSVIRQARIYAPYEPGRSQLIFITGVMGPLKANVTQRIGYFDANNGLFFQQDGVNLSVVRRTFTSGAPVDVVVNQSAWNVDKLDGTGPSGITIDMTKDQIFVIDFEWLGAGRVRFGFNIGGRIVYCDEMLNANVLSTVYMTTPILPIRYEIANTGVSASDTDMLATCCSVFSEGGFDPLGVSGAAITTLASFSGRAIAADTRTPLLSVRLKAAFNRGVLVPLEGDAMITAANNFQIEVVVGGTLSGGAAVTTSVDDATEMVTGTTTLTGGQRVSASLASNQSRALSTVIRSAVVTGVTIAGVTDFIHLVVMPLGSPSTFFGALNYREIY